MSSFNAGHEPLNTHAANAEPRSFSSHQERIAFLREKIQAKELLPEQFIALVSGEHGKWNDDIIKDILQFNEQKCRELNSIPYPSDLDSFPYMTSGASMIQRFIEEVPFGPESVLIDLGSGAGFPCLLTHLATGCRCIGIELQPDLCSEAQRLASALNIDDKVKFYNDDVTNFDISEGTHFYFFNPFRGPTMDTMVQRIHKLSTSRLVYVHSSGWCSAEDFLFHNFTEILPRQIYRSKM